MIQINVYARALAVPYHIRVQKNRRTTVLMEPPLWEALRRAAEEEGWTVDELAARIDEARRQDACEPTLTGTLRAFASAWLSRRANGGIDPSQQNP